MLARGRREFLAALAAEYAAVAMLPRYVEARIGFAVPSNIRHVIRESAGAKVPGVAVAWINECESNVVNVGNADVRGPVVDATTFEAASLSKPVFALAVLSLAARKKLHLDRPIADNVDLSDETDDPRVLTITPRHALSHTSGLPNWRLNAEPLRCKFAPGTRFAYSGEGIFLLQRAVEQITGAGLAAHMREAVFAPLGMSSSSFVYGHRLRDRLAAPHDASGQPTYHRTAILGEQLVRLAHERGVPLEQWTWPEMRVALPSLDPPQRPLPVFSLINAASSLLTTAHDYTTVMREIARHRSMTKAQIGVVPEVAWGLGVGLDLHPERLAFHWGDNDGFKAMMACRLGSSAGAVVLTNSDAGIAVAVRTLRAFFGNRRPSLTWVETMYR